MSTHFYGVRRRQYLSKILTCILTIAPSLSTAQSEGIIVQPQQDADFLGRKPEVTVNFTKNILPANFVLVLDGMDVTAASNFAKNSISYKSPIPVAAGTHYVTVIGYYEDTTLYRHDWSFNVKHSKRFDEISAQSNITLAYSRAIRKKSDALGNWTMQASGPVNGSLKDRGKEFGLNGSVYYYDQEEEFQSAVAEKGLDFRNFVIKGKHAVESLTTEISVGDLSITKTRYTAPSLYRRGAHIKLDIAGAAYSLFTVNSSQVVGVRNGLEVGFNTDENILGGSMEKTTANGNTTFNITYLTGTDSFIGNYAEAKPGVTGKGDVVGASVQQLVIPGKLALSFEGAYSNFDPDVTLDNDKYGDWAANTGLNWQATDKLNLQLVLEHLSKDFHSIGNAGLISDMQSINFTTALALARHNLSFNVYNGWSNLEDDPAVPSATQRQFSVRDDWRLKDNLLFNLQAYSDFVKSSEEPEGYAPTDQETLGINATVNYQKTIWSIQSMLSLSDTKDNTAADMDVSQDQFRLNVSWFPSLRIGINLMLPQYIRDKYEHLDVSTDSLSTSLSLNTWPIKDKLSFDLSQSFTTTEASDESRDEDNLYATSRLAYHLKKYFPDYARAALALGGEYSRIRNNIAGLEQSRYRVMLTVEVVANPGY